ncbi:MAG: 30S ribosomal protein S20 [bacterium]|nr:30S ribosomal protein S20 [bacterium]
MAKVKVNLKALKLSRQNQKRRAANKTLMNEIKTHYKNCLEAVHQKDKNKALEFSRKYISKMDKAVKNKILHKNNVSRHKAKVMKLVHRLSSAQPKE